MITNSIFLDTLLGKKRERPPVWFMRQAGRTLPNYNKLKEKYTFRELMLDSELAAEVTLMPIHDLGVDAAILFSDILVIPEAMGMELDFTDHGPIFRNALKDSKSPLNELHPEPDRLNYIYRNIDEIVRQRPPNIPLIGFCGGAFTTLCYMIQGLSSNHVFPDAVEFMYSKKETAKKLIDRITELSIIYARNQIKHGIDAFQLFETHAGLIPVKLYNELVMPSVKKIADAIRAEGVPFIFFPKGLGVGLSFVDEKIADCVSIDWQIPMKMARKMTGNKICLQGNLDPRLLLTDQDTILEELMEYLEFDAEDTKWIFNLGHGLLPEIPFENIKFVVDWIKKTDWKRDM